MRVLAFILAVVAGAGASIAPSQAGSGALTIDALMDIRYPSEARWSPDSRTIAYLWDRAGVQNIWVVGAREGVPRALTSFADGLIDSLDWSADGQHVLFVRGNHLMRVDAAGGEPQAVWSGTPGVGDLALSPDRTHAAFVRDGDLFVRPLADGAERQLTRGALGVSGPAWSADGRRIAFSVAKGARVEEHTPYAGSKVIFTRMNRDVGRIAVVAADGGAVTEFARSPGGEDTPRWLDANHVVLQRMSDDLRTREIVRGDVRTGAETVIHRDADPKFWSLTFLNAEPVPSPDGQWVAFVSDADGWDHLYVVAAAGGPAAQVTRGRFEVTRFAWSADATHIVFDRNDAEHPGARHLAVATRGSTWASPAIETLTSGRGTNTNAHWSPDGKRLVFDHTDAHNSTDLHVIDAATGAAPRRLTDSMPAGIDRAALVEPDLVHYAGPGGAQVPAYLFVPPQLDKSRKHPAIVWVHGDGINQNYDGWHIHRDYGVYYSFHQYLLQQGYVVLSVDYRGSIGYGRDWRQGHYRDLGGKDYGDIAAGVDYLKTIGYVDTERVGIWGLSYGGFMALQALTVTPDLFRCAIDVAGVEDWNDWYRDPGGPWIRARMGRPEEDPALYRRLSPIFHIDTITRPLLVLHGTSDVNVPFVESVRLIDALEKAGKPVEFVMFPGEFHYFQRAHVLRDAWRTADRFFARHLKN
jgi:dipeptidyl aminopeptidase/acylaminoacyl peptidase